MKPQIIFLLLFTTIFCQAQSLTISKGKSKRTFKLTNYSEVFLGNYSIEDKCYNCFSLKGLILGSKNDSLLIKIDQLVLAHDFSKPLLNHGMEHITNNPIKKIAKSDVVMIQKYKSKKSKQKQNARFNWGVLVAAGGVFTALNAVLFVDDKSVDPILIASGVQVVGGILFSLAFTPKKYRFQSNKKNWRFD